MKINFGVIIIGLLKSVNLIVFTNKLIELMEMVK